MKKPRKTIAKYHRHVGERGSDSLQGLLRWIPEGATVLDVGPATGALGEILMHERNCHVDGVEIDLAAAVVARPYYQHLIVADLERSSLDELWPRHFYNVIVFADVLEHLRNPAEVLRSAASRLRPGGEVLISIPNFAYAPVVAELLCGRLSYRETGILDDTHVRVYTRRNIRELVEEAGFVIVQLSRVERPPHLSEFGTMCLEALPPAVRAYLTHRPEAGTFQFLLRCGVRSEVAITDRIRIDDDHFWPVPLEFPVSLLWRHGDQDYDTGHQAVTMGRIGEGVQLLSLEFDEPAPDGLRLDLAGRAGLIELRSVRLFDSRGRELWSWQVEAKSIRRCGREGIVLAEPLEQQTGATLVLADGGGSLELPVGQGVLAQLDEGGRLDVELSWPPEPDYMLALDRIDGDLQELRDAEDRNRDLDRQLRVLQEILQERLNLLKEVEAQYAEAVRERDRALQLLQPNEQKV